MRVLQQKFWEELKNININKAKRKHASQNTLKNEVFVEGLKTKSASDFQIPPIECNSNEYVN